MRLDDDPDKCNPEDYIKPPSKNRRDLEVQLVLSLILGVSALIAFCILRPRWPSLYSARKRRPDQNIGLPALPNSFFGWMPKLYRVTEEQILASAGLDAFVFLAFFKMAIRLFMAMSFFAVVVLWPINSHYRHFQPYIDVLGGNQSSGDDDESDLYGPVRLPIYSHGLDSDPPGGGHKDRSSEKSFLWAYVAFTYFFVALTIYSINWETFRIVRFRQDYLGSQSTVTDRTFRLTGIPMRLRSEEKLKNLIERLDIGLVDSVTLCRNWKELDEVVEHRDQTLRKLEAAWAKYLKHQQTVTKHHSDATQTPNDDESVADARNHRGDEESGENSHLLASDSNRPHILEGDRPEIFIRYGPLKLRTRRVDAIDYYEEKLRRLDEKVIEARKKEYEAADMALVTMDSVASCQMVIQARIDPRPGRLLTKSTPSPSDLVWKNTYALRGVRRLKSWAITLFITFLTLIWIFPTAILASWLSICTIKRVLPSFYTWLSDHPLILSLFQNGAPTLVVSLLNVAVPYLYDFLSNHQGMISQGDVELSLISKNFFFTFFNTFFVFAVSRTGFDFWSVLRDFLKDTSKIPAVIASDVEELSIFYISFIMLQGIGLMPFRILEVGSVFLFPMYRMMSSTPRDYAELRNPPVFQYGFYLPTALLVFNLCLIYSVLKWGFVILVFGTIYFVLGYFTFKYMVMYAMDQPQHATGGAWRIICYRIVVGLVVFEVVMVGQIASLAAFVQSVTILPLIPFTIWYSVYFKRRFEPLTKYIALRAIKSGNHADSEEAVDDAFEGEDEPRQSQALLRRGSTLDEFKEKGLVFVNPSLVVPLHQPWIYNDPPPPLATGDTETDGDQSSHGQPALILPNADSSLGIGDDNVWMDNGRRDN
ncbi:Calcium permeable stress-gated cation channel 1 [Tolypocladium paradoxum]|uniref:Calcium permeable stress-gated cation channel 1 n=1 Tax=Tolypocladium paradoxum TaxID=94208 RepID=A0A2S4L6L5_9HYPO|nr:Calcium permeable stress-gated cation channel 1 [Tolypocladium paradoxum]